MLLTTLCFLFPITIATRLPAASDICETRTQRDAIKKEKENGYIHFLKIKSFQVAVVCCLVNIMNLYFSLRLSSFPLCESRAGFKPATTAVTHFTAFMSPSVPDTTPLNDPQRTPRNSHVQSITFMTVSQLGHIFSTAPFFHNNAVERLVFSWTLNHITNNTDNLLPSMSADYKIIFAQGYLTYH